MRLTRRRRRSLHDLDVGSAQYEDFPNNVPDRTEHLADWVNIILTEREQDDRMRRRNAVREAAARRREPPHHLAAHDPMRPDTPPPRRVLGARHRDILQLNERVDDRVIANFINPREALEIVQARLKQRIQQHIEYQYPGSSSDWEYAFDISRDVHNQQTNITITARRR